MNKMNAKILLISNEQEEYENLKSAGFKNISCFKSLLRAQDYFVEYPDEIKEFDIILFGGDTNKFQFNKQLDDLIDVANSQDVMHIEFYSSKIKSEQNNNTISIVAPFIELNITREEFINIITANLCGYLKSGNVSIPEVETTKKILPNSTSDVKILYLGKRDDINPLKKIFHENEFFDITFAGGIKPLKRYIHRIKDYDLVICNTMSGDSLAPLGKEFHNYLQDKERYPYFAEFNCSNLGHHNSIIHFSTINPDVQYRSIFSPTGNYEETLQDVVLYILDVYKRYNRKTLKHKSLKKRITKIEFDEEK